MTLAELFSSFRRPQSVRQALLWGVLTVVLIGFVAGLATVGYLLQDLPPITGLHEYQPSLVTRVYSADKQVIGQFFVERRILVPLEKIPRYLVNAVVAIEDSRFFEHRGLDFVGIARAAITNLVSGKIRQGASTITQQLARSLFLSPKRDYERKLALLKSGNAAIADVDHVRSDFVAATREAAAALAAMQVEISAREAAQNGVRVEPGSNDVTYSIQRADEIRILLTQIDRSIADLDSAAEQTREKLENHQRGKQTEASVIAPISGMIWKVGALNGERVNPGDVVLELVDCSRAFVVARIPQYRIPDVSVGMEAHFKFVGETSERLARVISVQSGGLRERVERFAALPLPEREPSATVILSPFSMPNTASECLMGRTARVLLPLRGDDLPRTLARWVGLDQIWHWLVS